MKSAHIVTLGLGIAALVGVSSCKQDTARGGKLGSVGDGGAPVPVRVVTLDTGRIEATLRFSATLRAEIQVQVLARTVGQVRARLVEEGDRVKSNQILLRLEREQQASALRRAKAELAQAQRNLDAQKKLHTSGVVSDQTLDDATFRVRQLAIARDDAARNLKYTVVRAPISGIITKRTVKRGDFVNPNQAMFEITDFRSLVAEVFVPEKQLQRLVVGGVARVQSPSANPSGTSLGESAIKRIAPVVDPRTGTVKVTIGLSEASTTHKARPGMFVDVELVVDNRANAVLLPRRALVYDNDEPYAFKLLENSRVRRVRVEAAVEDKSNIEPSSGFAAGDRVVIAGQVGLKDGARVAPAAEADAPKKVLPREARRIQSTDAAAKPTTAESSP